MKYQKIINLSDEKTNQPSNFRIRNQVEINDELNANYDESNIRLKTSIIRSNLRDHSDAYILVKGTIAVRNMVAAGAAVNNTNKKVILKNYNPFTKCISEISNIQVNDTENIDVVMPMCNLREHSDAYLKTSGRLWQYYRDEPALGTKNEIIVFSTKNNNSASFKCQQ